MARSQHKESKRECPACKQDRVFPERNETCSPECATALRASRTGKAEEGESHEVAGDTWTVTLPKTPIHTLEQLIAHCKVDTDIWEVEKFIVNKWEMGSINRASGDPQVTPLFQVKAFLRRSMVKVAMRAEIEALKKDLKQGLPTLPRRTKQTSSGIMLEVDIPDLHVGKLAWAKETGYTNYDSRIAEELHDAAVETILSRSRCHNLEAITYVVGNDLLNADNAQNTTTRGTPQHNDVRYQKTFRQARMMLCRAIEKFRKVAPVRVVVCPGNHDTLSAWCLGDSLECYFHNQADVTIDNQATKRKYLQWGDVMLMWTHGDKGKHNNYPLLMATEQKEMFGRTHWHEIHLGHLHQVSLRELNGVRVRILPSLSAADAWHSEMTFVGNVRCAEGFLWDKRDGLIGTVQYVAPDNNDRAPLAA